MTNQGKHTEKVLKFLGTHVLKLFKSAKLPELEQDG